MNSEIKKVEDLEVGKYYQKEEILFVKITGGIGENKTGTAVYLLDNMVLITDNFTPFDIAALKKQSFGLLFLSLSCQFFWTFCFEILDILFC